MSLTVGARVKVYDRDGSPLRGTFAAPGLSWLHGKDSASCSFSASSVEDDFAVDVFDEAVGVVELNTGTVTSPTWTPVATPYLLKADGDVVTDGPTTVSVSGNGAIGLASEWLVLHDEAAAYSTTSGEDINRRGPTEVYYGWMHPAYDDSGWATPERVDSSSLNPVSDVKANRPGGRFDDLGSFDWLWRDPDDQAGSLTLFRLGTFTITDDPAKVWIGMTADEEFRAYLSGPGQGGLIIDGATSGDGGQETGYLTYLEWEEVLQPGTYFLAAEMTTISTPGGDGFDALAFGVATLDGAGDTDTVLRDSGASGISVWRQPKDDPRPGFTVGQLVAILQENWKDWTGSGSSAHNLTRSFTDTDDSASVEWDDIGQRSWSVGTSVQQVLADLGDVADFDVNTSFELEAWTSKGSDLSATVGLVKGSTAQAADENLQAFTYTTAPRTMTRALIRTEDGFTALIDAGLEASYQRRGAYIESEQSSSIDSARALASRIINTDGSGTVEYRAECIGVPGAVPGVDFSWGDTIAGYNRAGATEDRRVLSYSAQREDSGVVMFSLEMR